MSALRIALLGAESTGKSTLAAALHISLQQLTGLRIGRVDEVLREWCDREGRTPQPHEQRAIAEEQERRVEALTADHDLVLSDTTALMTALYSEHLFADSSLTAWAQAQHRRYRLSLLMGLDLPWIADGHQRDGPHVREPVDRALRRMLRDAGHPFVVIQGQGPARLEHALDALTPLLAAPTTNERAEAPASGGSGLFSRLLARQSRLPGSTRWTCELCDDPACEHALKSPSGPRDHTSP